MLPALAAVSSCANDNDVTAGLGDISLSAGDHYKSSVIDEAGSSRFIHICPQVHAPLSYICTLYLHPHLFFILIPVAFFTYVSQYT